MTDRDQLRADVSLGKRLTGTYQADSDPDYYRAMGRIFESVPQLLDQLDRWEWRSGGHIQTDVDEWCDENDLLREDLASAESERNLTAVALAQAVIRADKAEAQVRHLKTKYDEDMEQLRREHDGDMEVLTSRIQGVNDVIDRHVEILGFDAVVPVERLWKVLE